MKQWRYEPGWLDQCLKRERVIWIGQVGDYDLWWDRNLSTVTVVAPDAKKTDFEIDRDGNLVVSKDDTDEGVRPEPYAMCLIYEAVGNFPKTKEN